MSDDELDAAIRRLAELKRQRAMCEGWAAVADDDDNAEQWQERADALTGSIEAVETIIAKATTP